MFNRLHKIFLDKSLYSRYSLYILYISIYFLIGRIKSFYPYVTGLHEKPDEDQSIYQSIGFINSF